MRLPVGIVQLPSGSLQLRGKTINADRYRISGQSKSGPQMQIGLWYSLDRESLALK